MSKLNEIMTLREIREKLTSERVITIGNCLCNEFGILKKGSREKVFSKRLVNRINIAKHSCVVKQLQKVKRSDQYAN